MCPLIGGFGGLGVLGGFDIGSCHKEKTNEYSDKEAQERFEAALKPSQEAKKPNVKKAEPTKRKKTT